MEEEEIMTKIRAFLEKRAELEAESSYFILKSLQEEYWNEIRGIGEEEPEEDEPQDDEFEDDDDPDDLQDDEPEEDIEELEPEKVSKKASKPPQKKGKIVVKKLKIKKPDDFDEDDL